MLNKDGKEVNEDSDENIVQSLENFEEDIG
jgi:hypothetical protein